MGKLTFKDDKEALRRLSDAQAAIDDFEEQHPGSWTEDEHAEHREMLNNRAKALSEATGLEIHSLFE